MTRRQRHKIVRSILIVLVTVFFIFPIIMIFLTSIKTRIDALAVPPVWIFKPTLENYLGIFQLYDFLQYFINSTIAAIASTAVAVILGAPAAYVLARYDFKAKSNLAFWILSLRMTPAIAAIMLLFVLLPTRGVRGTMEGLILVYSTFNPPFMI